MSFFAAKSAAPMVRQHSLWMTPARRGRNDAAAPGGASIVSEPIADLKGNVRASHSEEMMRAGSTT
jgi:hypothetical protein